MAFRTRAGRYRSDRSSRSRLPAIVLVAFGLTVLTALNTLPIAPTTAQESQNEILSASPATEDGRRQAFLDLTTTFRLLAIATHPGDEDLATLAMVRRGQGVRTRIHYVTAGERHGAGGPAVGVRRIAESRRAAAAVGARVSHALFPDVEAQTAFPAAWQRAALVESLVRAIREFRPHVVLIADRAGMRRQGTDANAARVENPALHAHVHAVVSEAIDAAADRAQFDDHLQALLYPWNVARVYSPATPSEATVALSIGDRDSRLGARYTEIAAGARAHYATVGAGDAKAVEKAYFRQTYGAPSKAADGPVGSLFDGLVAFDKAELGLSTDRDFRRVREVEDKIIRTGFKLLEVGGQEDEATKLLLDATKGLHDLNAHPYARRRLQPGEFLDEIGYQHFFRMRGPDLAEAMRQVLGISFTAKAEAAPVAPGETYQVSAVLTLASGKKLENATIRIDRTDAASATYVEQSNRVLERDDPIRAFFKVRISEKAKPSRPLVAFADRRLHEDMTCIVSARLGKHLVAYTVPLSVPPIVAPVQLDVPDRVTVDASGTADLVAKFKTQGPLYSLGGRPKKGVMTFKLQAKAPSGVVVEPGEVELRNRRSGYETEHAFRMKVDGPPPAEPVVFEVQRWKDGEPIGPVFRVRTSVARSGDAPK